MFLFGKSMRAKMRCEIMKNKIQRWRELEGTLMYANEASFMSSLRRVVVTNEVNNKVENYFIIQYSPLT